MKYSKISKLSKVIIATSLFAGAATGLIIPLVTTNNINAATNNDQKNHTGRIIHDSSTQVVNNISDVQIETVNNSLQDFSRNSSSAIVNNNGVQEFYVWGDNSYGTLGLGNSNDQLTPIKLDLSVFGQYDSLEIKIGNRNSSTSYAITKSLNTSRLYLWGRNLNGQLGLGNKTNQLVPLEINKSLLGNFDSVLGVYSAYSTLHVLVSKNGKQELYGSGTNNYGQLGIGNTTEQSNFKLVSNSALGNYTSILKFENNSYAMSALIINNNEMSLYVWGRNDYGQLGFGNTSSYSSPTLQNNSIFSSNNLLNTEYKIDTWSSYALNRITNQLYTWGNNNSGGLGLGGSSTSSRTAPVQVPSSSLGNGIIKKISISLSSYVIVNINNIDCIYVFGQNDYGQLGIGNTTNQFSPYIFDLAKIANPSSIIKFDVGTNEYTGWYSSSALVKIDNEIRFYSWGYNNNGQLANGSTTNSSSPNLMILPEGMTLINADIGISTWLHLIDSFGKTRYFVAGYNANGELGLSNSNPQPRLVESLPTRYTNFTAKEIDSSLSSPDALNFIKMNIKTNLQNYINILNVPLNSVISIDENNTYTSYKTGFMKLTLIASLTYAPLCSVNNTTNTPYTIDLQFKPVSDIAESPVKVASQIPEGIDNSAAFYEKIMDNNGVVKNRPLLSSYIDLTSIPETATLTMAIKNTDSEQKVDFTLLTNQIYETNGITTLAPKTFNLTFELPYINLAMILGISIPSGILLIGVIIFMVWYFKFKY